MARQICASPRIEVREQDIFFDGRPLGLQRKPLMRRLFELFTISPEKTVSRHTLLKSLYEQGEDRPYSERYRHSCTQNLIKLISRARRFLADTAQGWEWFVYDARTEMWRLYEAKGGRMRS